jgi:hypothetical protein
VLTAVHSRWRGLRALVPVGLLALGAACSPSDAPRGADPLGPDLTDPRPDSAARAPATWSFTGATPAPVPFAEPGWDVQVHSRDRETWLAPQPMDAHHAADCGPHPGTHRITRYDQMVFRCRDHLMTAIRADGYGVIVLTPDRLLDWSGGEAVLRFDVSTFRSSSRDWIKVWISPFDEQLPVPAGEFVPDLNGPPANGVFVEMTGNGNLCPRVVRAFVVTPLACDDWRDLSERVPASATARATVEVRLSRTRMRVSMPQHAVVFADVALPSPLSFTQGAVQLAHYSYTPDKCEGCQGANTWHWDEVHLAPSVPFRIVRGDRRYVDGSGGEVRFAAPAPAGARLRFVAVGVAPEVSVDGGTTWTPAVEQRVSRLNDPVRQYFMPVPSGTQRVLLRAGTPIGWWPHRDVWMARDFSLWARSP